MPGRSRREEAWRGWYYANASIVSEDHLDRREGRESTHLWHHDTAIGLLQPPENHVGQFAANQRADDRSDAKG